MKAILLVFAILCSMWANVDKDIELTSKKLEKNTSQKSQITQKLNDLGKAINKTNAQIIELDAKISALNDDLKVNEAKKGEQDELLKDAKHRAQVLQKQKDQIQKDLISIVTNSLAFYSMSAKQQKSGEKEVIIEEMYKIFRKDTKDKIKILSERQSKNQNELSNLNVSIKALQTAIASQKTRQATLIEMHKNQELLIAKLEDELRVYNQKLKDSDKERQSINTILSNLKITKEKKINEEKREAQAKKDAQKEETAIATINKKRALQAPIEVRKVASSYRDISTTKYKGSKTIAPLDNFTIEQKFGQYFDPVYKIKVFSESVILSPKFTDSSVKAVMDGKIVFAKNTAMLKRVIIIEHSNSLHTIYTHLDKIAPNIKVGSKIKKAFVIGKVDTRLGFETTLKDKHFDPMELISSK